MRVPAVAIIEFFPPSAATELRSLVRKYNPSISLFGGEKEAVSLLSQSRSGRGYSWFGLQFVQAPGSSARVPDSRIEKLPDPFWGVELTAIQLGTGLTAIVARFHLTADAAGALDREWHRQHQPRLRRQGQHLLADDRQWAAYYQTQSARRRPHDAARRWMSANCRGLFAQSGEAQPLMDLLILENHNPTDGRRMTRADDVALRALGLTGLHQRVISPVVPEFALTPVELEMCPAMQTNRTWALWGNRAAALAARPGLTKYHGSDEYRALAHAFDHEIRDVFLVLSISEMVDLMQEQYTKLRDTARQQHRLFSRRYLQALRQTLLTLSIDLSTSNVDVVAWWGRQRRQIPPFFVTYPDDDATDNGSPLELTEHLRSRQTDDLARLFEADATTRDILSTVASLGAAGDTARVSRIALYVSAGGLLVAMTTLLVTAVGPGSLAAHVWGWLQHHI